jgi:hypothetical protein
MLISIPLINFKCPSQATFTHVDVQKLVIQTEDEHHHDLNHSGLSVERGASITINDGVAHGGHGISHDGRQSHHGKFDPADYKEHPQDKWGRYEYAMAGM